MPEKKKAGRTITLELTMKTIGLVLLVTVLAIGWPGTTGAQYQAQAPCGGWVLWTWGTEYTRDTQWWRPDAGYPTYEMCYQMQAFTEKQNFRMAEEQVQRTGKLLLGLEVKCFPSGFRPDVRR